MKIKKRTKKIIVPVLILAALVMYCSYGFKKQKYQLAKIIAPSALGNVKKTLNNLDSVKGFSNPLVHIIYKYHFKRKYHNRFIKNEKESVSNNNVLNEIANIYKEYWKLKLLKKDTLSLANSLLQKNLYNFLKKENLTTLSFKEYGSTELNRIIEDQGAKVEFFYLNEIHGITIWDKETINNYIIELPNNTININVTIIENYILKGYAYYATVGDSQTGGWVNRNKANIFCNKGEYNLSSEKFLIGFLKHEGLHFIDVKKFSNLSATDLEYRSKIVELMYLDDFMYDRIEEFIIFASSRNRNFSHPYANYVIIKDLSRLFFNSDFESDISKWKKIPVKKINEASLKLLEKNNAILAKNPEINKIIN